MELAFFFFLFKKQVLQDINLPKAEYFACFKILKALVFLSCENLAIIVNKNVISLTIYPNEAVHFYFNQYTVK